MYSHSNSRSAYNYLLAVRFTVTASENLGSFAQSQVCSAHSALVTQPIRVTTAKQENEPADGSNSAAFYNMQLAWIHNVNPGAQALFVTVCISKRKTPDGWSLQYEKEIPILALSSAFCGVELWNYLWRMNC